MLIGNTLIVLCLYTLWDDEAGLFVLIIPRLSFLVVKMLSFTHLKYENYELQLPMQTKLYNFSSFLF